MAVKGEAGINEISFSYFPPGLKVGLLISGGVLIVSGVYLLRIRRIQTKFKISKDY